MQKIAVFDIDGTIFRSSLLIEVVEALIQEGIFSERVRNIYKSSYTQWLNRKDSYEKYIQSVVLAFEQNIKGVRHEDFKRVAATVVAFHQNRVYRYTSQLVSHLKKEGYFLLAISHSPKELVDEFCTAWGFDKVYGRLYEIGKDGTFTGQTQYLDVISNKANVLKRFIEKEGLSLAESYGVGDSESDINFLAFVEHPICFNPNKKLYDHAQKSGWKVVVERKDVIYELSE